ncbi:uncharacterized protein IUM83_05910 [Phytophthora cinnamomi]|uniref:uncharacterized protein n=1 Tax=Phytophthora cinnamomi TaxID=4785 RepID=UPI00355A7023|nr:hypothetical protein IUM83_05910 [Phytophthora cinnamomi]
MAEARQRFLLVMRTTKWIDNVEWRVADLREPFTDTRNVTKSEHKASVETLNLSVNGVPGECLNGHQLLDFRENLWLHTTSILLSLMVLRDEYPGVGVISPSYHDFTMPEQKRRIAAGLGASEPKNKRIIGIIHIKHHWVALLIDRTIGSSNKKATCFMFDPQQRRSNYTVIEKSVRTVIEGVLQLGGMVAYEQVAWRTQQYSNSCGLWCIAVLEMLLSKSSWDDCLYNLVPYLGMRSLHKALGFLGKVAA